MIYFSSHKFAFSNLNFSSFYEHFRQLREKYAFKSKIVHHVNKLIEPDLMICIHITFSKSDHSTPLHALHLHTQNIRLAVKPFHCFFAKSWWAGKNCLYSIHYTLYSTVCIVHTVYTVQCKMYTVQCKLYIRSMLCTLCSVHCSVATCKLNIFNIKSTIWERCAPNERF